ncbi:MAG TPA: hypothetical protein DCS82_10695 [Rhodospirillaceae bacterium]|nr:hypothetical protein [Rhodospirillaceae bacterium]
MDLRVNSLKSDRAHATAELAKAGIAAENTRFSPLGLRLSAPQALDQLPVYRSGQVEIQDEGSQLVSLLCDAQPGMNVLDLCAGAGGKSLALAAQMKNQGAITLADIDETRLGRAAKRLERADVTVGEFCPVGSDWEAWCAAHAGLFDRVLVDVPCTGSGAWRRHPEARRRLTENGFSAFLKLQQELLRVALPLVKSGGRLIYATCSFFADENEKQIETLLAESDGVALLSAAKVWQAAVGGAFPGNDPYLRLSTYRHGTDGFFAAILERRG